MKYMYPTPCTYRFRFTNKTHHMHTLPHAPNDGLLSAIDPVITDWPGIFCMPSKQLTSIPE